MAYYSGVIELDTLMIDNIIHYRGAHEYKTSVKINIHFCIDATNFKFK